MNRKPTATNALYERLADFGAACVLSQASMPHAGHDSAIADGTAPVADVKLQCNISAPELMALLSVLTYRFFNQSRLTFIFAKCAADIPLFHCVNIELQPSDSVSALTQKISEQLHNEQACNFEQFQLVLRRLRANGFFSETEHPEFLILGLPDEQRLPVYMLQNFKFIADLNAQAGMLLTCHPDAGMFHAAAVRYFNALNDLPAWQETVSRFDFLCREEEQQILKFSYGEKVVKDIDAGLMWHINENIRTNADKPAIISRQATVSYREAGERSDAIAGTIKPFNLPPDAIIPVLIGQSDHWMIISMLGIIKANAAFCPIDPEMPSSRIALLLEELNSPIVLCTSVERDNVELKPILDNYAMIEADNPALKATEPVLHISAPGALAYCIFTSGTTGKPKGCLVTHGSLTNRILWMAREFNADGNDIILQKTSFSFDVSLWEIFLPLAIGGTMVLAGRAEAFDPAALLEIISSHRISLMHFVPGMLMQFQAYLQKKERRSCDSLRYIICSGERLLPETAKTHFALLNCGLSNLYGPTEAAIDVSCYHVKRDDEIIPIGKPVWNTSLFVMTPDLKLCMRGSAGQLYIGGIQVGKGYLNQPLRTAEAFIQNPFDKNDVLYATGDYVRWNKEGQLEYLGRKDEQIKLRGFRIELGEIENALLSHPKVSAAAVVLMKDAAGMHDTLTGFIECGDAVSEAEVNGYLTHLLPHYMLPGRIVQVQTMPLNTSGKTDKSKLKTIPANAAPINSIAFENETEQEIFTIWQKYFQGQFDRYTNFFELGGHSLLAGSISLAVSDRFNIELKPSDIFLNPTIEALAGLVKNELPREAPATIPKAPLQQYYPLSAAQQRLWLLSQLSEESSAAYNVAGAFVVRGKLYDDILESCFRSLIIRHEILRTSIICQDERPLQLIHEADECFPVLSVQHMEDSGDEEVANYVQSQLTAPFDLTGRILFKAGQIVLRNDESILWVKMHHLITDGYSVNIMMKELFDRYRSFILQVPYSPDPLQIQYKDYSYWQFRQLQDGRFESLREYWQSGLSGELPVVTFPGLRVRPPVQSFKGSLLEFTLDNDAVRRTGMFCAEWRITPFSYIVALINILLHKYNNGQKDIIVGCTMAGRQLSQLSDQLGLYVNTVVQRNCVLPEGTVREFLMSVHSELASGLDHQNYPFDLLVNELKIRRDLSMPAVFNVLINYQHEAEIATQLPEPYPLAEVRPYPLKHTISKFDITFNFIQSPNAIHCSIEYNTDLYDEGQMCRLSDQFAALFRLLPQAQQQTIAGLDYLPAHEKTLIQTSMNGPVYTGGENDTIISLFQRSVHRHPETIAICDRRGSYTYRQLDQLSDQIASFLIRKYRIRQAAVIGVMMSRNMPMVACLLGVLKCGAAYVPLDPQYPAERNAYIIANSGMDLLVTDLPEANTSYDVPVVDINAEMPVISAEVMCNSPFPVLHSSAAYIIYTSGSTGMPKGVCIRHENTVNLLKALLSFYSGTEIESVFAATSICFDLSIFELFMPLYAGKRIVIADSINELPHFSANNISVINTVPSALDALLKIKGIPSTVSIINIAGEPFDATLIKRSFAGTGARYLFNLYGPTETTTYSTYKKYERNTDFAQVNSNNIGKPLLNTCIHILDEHRSLVPVGAQGEIYISGAGVAAGYINQPPEACENFFILDGRRAYRTGDLGYWTPEGEIIFMGRKDSQVKLRGYRIELSEVRHHIMKIRDVESCELTIENNNSIRYLIAYVKTAAKLTESGITQELKKFLPAHMIPHRILVLEAMPLTVNGKINKNALRQIWLSSLPSLSSLPENETPVIENEEAILEIWRSVLNTRSLSAEADFFQAGGDSLTALILSNQISRNLAVRFELKDVFLYPTVRSQAAAIKQLEKLHPIPRSPQPAADAYFDLSYSQRRIWAESIMSSDPTIHSMYGVYRVKGDVDGDALRLALIAVVRDNEILRTVFTTVEGQPKQCVLPAENSLPECNTFHLPGGGEQAIPSILKSASDRPFNLSKGPLLRVVLIRTGIDECMLFINVHHIVADGKSMAGLIAEVLGHYEFVRNGVQPPIKEQLQYRDFVLWEQAKLNSEYLARGKRFWQANLKHNLHINIPAPVHNVHDEMPQEHFIVPIQSELVTQIRQYAAEKKVTPFIYVLSALFDVLHKWSLQEVLTIVTPVSGRTHPDIEKMIGCFINLLPVQVTVAGDTSFESLLQQTNSVFNQFISYQDYPFNMMWNQLRAAGNDPSKTPAPEMFNVGFTWHYASESLENINSEFVFQEIKMPARSKAALWFHMRETQDSWSIHIDFNAGNVKGSAIRELVRLLDHAVNAGVCTVMEEMAAT